MKKLLLITYDLPNALHYRQELLDFFGNIIEIETHTIADGIGEDLRGNLALVLSPINNEELMSHFAEDIEILHAQKVLTKSGYRKLLQLPPGKKVMLMTTNKTSAFEMTTYLYQIGINHLDFLPSHPHNEEVFDVDTAVTPGQLQFIPMYIKTIVDIGWRKIAPDALMSVMISLNLQTEALLEKLYRFSREILTNDFTVTSLDTLSRTREFFYLAGNLIDDGILILNNDQKVLYVNHNFFSMLELPQMDGAFPAPLPKLPPEILRQIRTSKEIDQIILHLESSRQIYALSKHPFSYYKEKSGDIIILKNAKKIEKLETEIRKSSAIHTYHAKYSFDSLIGESRAFRFCVDRAKKIATTEMPVLLTGESGTGKELFAQAIHNASRRADKPFVALNCAALSNELLESELFGYEDGAFTGARKGGKKGLFEFAHQGTMFLDEIGDMPLLLQAKLLRVLQEKEIRKIGSNVTIPVDVRIITATNRALKEMVAFKEFRLDLYYRISAAEIQLPPLRLREKDLLLLARHFLPAGKTLSRELSSFLLKQSWPGNIRELQNCIEYTANMGAACLTTDDLPPSYLTEAEKNLSVSGSESLPVATILGSAHAPFDSLPLRQHSLCLSLLHLLLEEPMGRSRMLKRLNYEYTEHEIKKALDFLSIHHFLSVGKGRSGTALSEGGFERAKALFS